MPQTITDFEKVNFQLINKYFLNCDSLLFKQNKQDTLFVDFDKEKIKIIITYKQGKKIRAVGYYQNGLLYRETNYDGYRMHGLDAMWYSNGQIEYSASFFHGKILSPSIDWYEDGSIKKVCIKSSDKKNAFFDYEYYKSGSIKFTAEGIDSSKYGCIEKNYYENGGLESYFVLNVGSQPFVCYDSIGNKRKCGFIFNVHFLTLGHWQEWYENGVIKREYFFHDSIPNQKEGIWKWFDEKGNLIKEEYYKNGEKTGEKEYVPNKKQNEK